jgi:hypothetical protein
VNAASDPSATSAEPPRGRRYDLNTVLQKDKTIGSKMEAVSRTMRIIAAALENTNDFR